MSFFNLETNFSDPSIKLSFAHRHISMCPIDYNDDFRVFQYGQNTEYRDVWSGIDINYEHTENGVKEFIKIPSIDSKHSFSFKLSTNLKYKKINDNLCLVDRFSNRPFFKLDDFIVLDYDGNHLESYHLDMDFDEKTGIFSINLSGVDEDHYPVIIDPSIVVIPLNTSPINQSEKKSMVDLDIIHRKDIIGTDYHEKQYGKDFHGDQVSFSRKVDLRINLEGPTKIPSTVSNKKNFDIQSIQDEVAGIKYVTKSPLLRESQEALTGQTTNVIGGLSLSKKQLSNESNKSVDVSFAINENIVNPEDVKIKWSVFAIDLYTKKQIFTQEQIEDKSYIDKIYGKCNFTGNDNKEIKYTISDNLKFTYLVLFSVDIYEKEISKENYKGTVTDFAKVFSGAISGAGVSVSFSLDPNFIHINEENKSNEFEIDVVVPKFSIPYIGANIYKWRIKTFDSGNVETVVTSDQYGEATAYGTIVPNENTKTLTFTPPSDISFYEKPVFIEAYTTFFDPISYQDKEIYASCVVSSALFQIAPSFLRPTICDQEDILYRLHNFSVRPVDANSNDPIPNLIANNLNWTLYADDDTNDNIGLYETWKVIDPDADGQEISDTHTNDGLTIYEKYKKYGGIGDHYHIDSSLESISYTLGNREDVISSVENDGLPERLYLTYRYNNDSGSQSEILAIIQPTDVAPEDCSDKQFSISLDPHCIISEEGKTSVVTALLSSDIIPVFNANPSDFLMVWEVYKVNPDTGTKTKLEEGSVYDLTSNIKSIIVKHPSSDILENTNQYLIIRATLIYIPENKTAFDTAFVFKNRTGIISPKSITVPYNSGKRISVTFDPNDKTNISVIQNSLTYKHTEDYANTTVGLRKIRIEVLNPITGEIATNVDSALSGSGNNSLQTYGYGFLDYQYPKYDTANNKLVKDSSYRLSDKGITFKSPKTKSNFDYVVLRVGFSDPTTGSYEFVYTCIEFIDQIYPTYYPDILKPQINGVGVKETSSDKNEFFSDFLMEPDKAYEFKISNDIYDDGAKEKTIPLKGYEIKVWYSGSNNQIKILESHKYTISSTNVVTQESKRGILQEFGIQTMPDRCYLVSDVQYWNFQTPPKTNPFSNSTSYYNDLYDSTTGQLKTPLYISVIGERDDAYESIIETTRYLFKKIPVESTEYVVYKNPKNGFVGSATDPLTGDKKSIWLVDPFPSSLIDLSRYYDEETDYYLYVVSTDYERIQNNNAPPEIFNFFIDNTPDDEFNSSFKVIGKSFYELQITHTATDSSANSQSATGLQWESKFANRGPTSLDSDIGKAEIVGGMQFEGKLSDFFSRFTENFAFTYSGSNSRLDNRLLNFLVENTQVTKNEFSNNTEDPQQNVALQLLVFKWKSPSFKSDGTRKTIKLNALSGKHNYNINDTLSIGNPPVVVQKESYYESATLTLSEPDDKPLSDDSIYENSLYSNRYNGDLYVGLSSNGMKYMVFNNLEEYEAPDTTNFGITYDPDLEENVLTRFNFPEYRHSNDKIVNYDFTQLNGDGRIDIEGIAFPSTVTCFYLYFDHINIKYILFFGTESDGLWCFDDIDIYGPNRTLKVDGLAKKVFSADLFAPNVSLSNKIVDITIGFPSLDLYFVTADTFYVLKAEDISSYVLNPLEFYPSGGLTTSELWQSKVLSKISKYNLSGTELFSGWLEHSGNDIKRINSIVPIAKPVQTGGSVTEHSGNILISPTEQASACGVILTVVTEDYDHTTQGSLGDAIYHIEFLMDATATNRSVIEITTAPATNTVASSSGSREALDSNNNAINIPSLKESSEVYVDQTLTQKSFQDIDAAISINARYHNQSGSSSFAIIGSMHRQNTFSTKWSGTGLDDDLYDSISLEYGASGIDSNDNALSGLGEGVITNGKAFLNPLQAFVPKHTRPGDTKRQSYGGTLIGSAGSHVSVNGTYRFTTVDVGASTLFSLSVPTTNPNDADDGDIFWRLYYNLMIKDSTESVYDFGPYSGFHYTDDPESQYTLIQIPRVDSPTGKSIWLYENSSLTISSFVNAINNEILQNGKILYYRDFNNVLSFKLNNTFTSSSSIKALNLISGSFLKNLTTSLGSASNGDLVYTGGGTVAEIDNYLLNSGRDFILIKHSAKKEIFNSQSIASNFIQYERRVYWNGFRGAPLSAGMRPVYIVEQVPLYSTTDTDDSERSVFVGGNTYYEGKDVTSDGFKMFIEELDIEDFDTEVPSEVTIQDKGMYIPDGIPGNSDTTTMSLDYMGTVIYAQNDEKFYLNPLCSEEPISYYDSSIYHGHGVVDYDDRADFRGKDSGGANIFDVNDSYSQPDKYLYPQNFDYMKVTRYFSSKRTLDENDTKLHNHLPIGSEWIDIHGLWAHTFHEDQLATPTDKLDDETGTRRERLFSLLNDATSLSGTYWRENTQFRMGSFSPNWAYDGFWKIDSFNFPVDIDYANEAFPIIIKQPFPVMFYGDSKIREEEQLYTNNVSGFTSKAWFVTHFAYSSNYNYLFYSVKNKNLTSTSYWQNKIHILYLGDRNVCGYDLSTDNVYDFTTLFPHDYSNISEIKGLIEYGNIDAITYDNDVYEGIDPAFVDSFNISGNLEVQTGTATPDDFTIQVFSGQNVIVPIHPNKNTGNWQINGLENNEFSSYFVLAFLDGYTIEPDGIDFSGSDYTSKNFKFVANYTGQANPSYPVYGHAYLYDETGQVMESSHGGIIIYGKPQSGVAIAGASTNSSGAFALQSIPYGEPYTIFAAVSGYNTSQSVTVTQPIYDVVLKLTKSSSSTSTPPTDPTTPTTPTDPTTSTTWTGTIVFNLAPYTRAIVTATRPDGTIHGQDQFLNNSANSTTLTKQYQFDKGIPLTLTVDTISTIANKITSFSPSSIAISESSPMANFTVFSNDPPIQTFEGRVEISLGNGDFINDDVRGYLSFTIFDGTTRGEILTREIRNEFGVKVYRIQGLDQSKNYLVSYSGQITKPYGLNPTFFNEPNPKSLNNSQKLVQIYYRDPKYLPVGNLLGTEYINVQTTFEPDPVSTSSTSSGSTGGSTSTTSGGTTGSTTPPSQPFVPSIGSTGSGGTTTDPETGSGGSTTDSQFDRQMLFNIGLLIDSKESSMMKNESIRITETDSNEVVLEVTDDGLTKKEITVNSWRGNFKVEFISPYRDSINLDGFGTRVIDFSKSSPPYKFGASAVVTRPLRGIVDPYANDYVFRNGTETWTYKKKGFIKAIENEESIGNGVIDSKISLRFYNVVKGDYIEFSNSQNYSILGKQYLELNVKTNTQEWNNDLFLLINLLKDGKVIGSTPLGDNYGVGIHTDSFDWEQAKIPLSDFNLSTNTIDGIRIDIAGIPEPARKFYIDNIQFL